MFKVEWNKNYTLLAIYACIILVIAIVAMLIGLNILGIADFAGRFLGACSPIIGGFIIAYLFTPMCDFFDGRLFAFVEKKKPRKVLRRALALALTYFIIVSCIVIFITTIVPQIYESYNDFHEKLDDYIATAEKIANDFVTTSPIFSGAYSNLDEFIDLSGFADGIGDIIQNSYSYIDRVAGDILNYGNMILIGTANAVLSIILSSYFIMEKETIMKSLRRTARAIFSERHVERIRISLRSTDKTFGGFIAGKLLDSLILGIISIIVFSLFKIPYAPLLSLIVAVTNMIPYFGAIFGAVVCTLLLLLAGNFSKGLWFLVIVIILQQIDGNYIGPKILGKTVGLSPLWVVIAITVMGAMFGLIGMFIGVPVFAVIYDLTGEFTNRKLRRKGMSENTDDYADAVKKE